MDVEARKHTLRMLHHGLYVLSARHGEAVTANTVTWVTQTSFRPPLVAVAIRVEGLLHHLIASSGGFAANLVGAGQQALAAAFFRPAEVTETAINGYGYEAGPETGAPVLLDAPAWFEARVRERVAGGDHTLFLAEVVSAGVRDASASALALRDTPWMYGG